MGKIRLETEKLYWVFPIFLVGYRDSVHGYNFTTVSSSYSLGDMVVVGIWRFGNALKQIRDAGCFTVNIPDRSLMREIEVGGYNSGVDKFGIASELSYFVSERVDAPVIEGCFLNIECEVVEIIENDELPNYSNIIAKVKGRYIDENLQEDGVIIRDLINPVLYLGDGHGRSYRYLK